MARKYGTVTSPSSGLISVALKGNASSTRRLAEQQQMDAI